MAAHTESEQIAALGHLAHEISTMIEAWHRVDEIDRSATGTALERVAYLECALLHARNLIEFLAASSTGDDYMKPGDFQPGWDYRKTADLRRELGALSEHLAHLSWKRVSDRAGTLSPDVLERILQGCKDFYDAISAIAGATQVRAALDKAKALSIPNPGNGPSYRPIQLTTTSPSHVTITGFDQFRPD